MSVASLPLGSRVPSMRSSTTPLLAAALLAATGWAVLSGGWSESTVSAVLVGLAGTLEAVLLARTRLHRGLALLAAPFLLLVSLLPTTLGTRPAAASDAISHVVAQYAGAASTGLLGNDAWEFNVGLSALLWLCGAWAGWFAVRERRGALATGPCWAVLAVTVINAPSASAVGVPATATAVAAIMLIAAAHLDRLNDGWRQRRVGVLPGTDGRFATAAAAGGVVIVLFALVVPPLTSTDISGRLFGFGSGRGSGSGSGPGSGQGVGPDGTVRFNPSTVPGGALTEVNTPVLTYQSSNSAGLYLQMATDGEFEGGNWLPDQSALGNGDFTQEVVPAGTIPRDRTMADGGVGADQQPVSASVSVTDDTSGSNVLPFPGEPEAASVGSRVNGLAPGGRLLTVDSVEAVKQIAGTSFVVTGTQSTASADALRNAGTSYPSFIAADDFLQLPTDGTQRDISLIASLAQSWTQGETNAFDKATTIETMLRDPRLFHYTLTPPLPPSSVHEWPVTYFLSVSHSGYCQYFATAMGAMLRTLNIPSRLVNGYGPGTTPDSASHGVDAESIWHVSSNDAHTWVEAYFPGYGWIPFEPTPPSSAGDYVPFSRGGGSSTPPGVTATPAPTPAATTVTPDTSSADGSSGGAGGIPAVLRNIGLGVLALLIPLGLFAAWFVRPRGVRGVWRRLGLVGALAGVPRGSPLTFHEYADRLRPVVTAPLSGDSLSAIAQISDRALYARDGLVAEDARQLELAWRRLARLVPRLGWQALRRRPVSR